MNIEVSFVITVFNKSKSITITLQSIIRQVGDIKCEYIFADDASSDDSIDVIKKFFKMQSQAVHNYQYKIIKSAKNYGPAIQLNKGAKSSVGKYLFLIDADDILIDGAFKVMLNAIKNQDADFVFGFVKRSHLLAQSILELKINPHASYQVSESPFYDTLKRKPVGMAYLVKNNFYIQCGGADERLFVQDESLPLRLGYLAKRAIFLNEVAVYSGEYSRELSKNEAGQMCDGFYAYYFAFADFGFADLGFADVTSTDVESADVAPTDIASTDIITYKKKCRNILISRMISLIWKVKKKFGNIKDVLLFIAPYAINKMFPSLLSYEFIKKNKRFIDLLRTKV